MHVTVWTLYVEIMCTALQKNTAEALETWQYLA
jgi:hypothetical protein